MSPLTTLTLEGGRRPLWAVGERCRRGHDPLPDGPGAEGGGSRMLEPKALRALGLRLVPRTVPGTEPTLGKELVSDGRRRWSRTAWVWPSRLAVPPWARAYPL